MMIPLIISSSFGELWEERKMSICMVGIDHNRADVDVRALFSFTKKNAAAAMLGWKKVPGILGCVVISTCNRMELWASTEEEWDGDLLSFCASPRRWIPPSTSVILSAARTGRRLSICSGLPRVWNP